LQERRSLTNSTATKGNQLLSIQQENASLQQQLEGALAADKHAQKDKSQFITTAKGLAEETRSSQTMIPGTVTFSDQQKHSTTNNFVLVFNPNASTGHCSS